MDLEQTQSWLSLAQQPYPIINEFLKQLSATNIENNLPDLINHWLKKNHCHINQHQIEKSLLWLQQPNHTLLAFDQYPVQLKVINSPPPILFLAGKPSLLTTSQLAIVGSRKPTAGGRENALYFSSALAEAGLTLVSGLATGIDGIAHQSALETDGLTVAVLGCGHKTCYPKKHQPLLDQILEKGLVVSEFTPDTPVKPYQFPRRNRIISGLSLGVLVIEASIKSGSLITCRLAADQGREVFAIPGDITNPLSRGCHHLIRHGACLIDHPEQILEALNFSKAQALWPKKKATIQGNHQGHQLSQDETRLLQSINRHPTSIDCLVNRTRMQMPLVLSVLFSLELKRLVVSSADGYFK